MSPAWTIDALLVGLKYLSINSPGWGLFGTNPKILESLEGPEGYLCPGIHDLGLGVICMYHKHFSTSGLSLINNRMVGKPQAPEAYKVGSKVGD